MPSNPLVGCFIPLPTYTSRIYSEYQNLQLQTQGFPKPGAYAKPERKLQKVKIIFVAALEQCYKRTLTLNPKSDSILSEKYAT